jgi:O-antigen ligase
MAEARLQVVRDREAPGRTGQPVDDRVASAVRSAAAPGTDPSLPALLVLAALGSAIVGQGAYYPATQRVVAVLLGAAAVAGLVRTRLRWPICRPLVGATALLGGWALTSAALAGDLAAAASTVLLLAGAVVIVLTCARCSCEQRGQLLVGIVALGVVVAVSGWAGVAWRRSPWALEDQGLWRAATTITYANAAAGVLAAVALLALGRCAASVTPSVFMTGATCLLLTGLGATLSRGGLVAFVAGALVLARIVGFRVLVKAALIPTVGAAVALVGLLASVPAPSPARPLLAAVTLAMGLLLAVMAGRIRGRLAVAVVVVGACALGVTEGNRLVDAGGAIVPPRLTVASADRAEAARAALRVAGTRPLVGVGPGKAHLRWSRPDGSVAIARYAHNEYLQVLAELGVVGLGILLSLFFVIGQAVRRGRHASPPPGMWAGAVAGLVALGVHGLFDFGWHVPALPLTAAALVGIVTTTSRKEKE